MSIAGERAVPAAEKRRRRCSRGDAAEAAGPWGATGRGMGRGMARKGHETWLGNPQSTWALSLDLEYMGIIEVVDFPCLGTIPRQDNGADGGGMDLVVEGGWVGTLGILGA